MSKKHYTAIAKILATQKTIAPEHRRSIESIAKQLAYYFKLENSRFDKERFLEAAGFGN